MPLSSKTELCNLALAELGARRINSYESDSSVEATACRLHLERILSGLLRRHQWSFAIARAALSAGAGDAPTGWSKAWALPADLVRLIDLPTEDPRNPWREYAIEGRTLLTSGLEEVEIRYVSNAVPPAEWDDLFIDAAALLLASRIANTVTQNPALADAALAKFSQLALPAAQTADAAESLSGENYGSLHAISASGLVNARFRNDGRPPHLAGSSRTVDLP